MQGWGFRRVNVVGPVSPPLTLPWCVHQERTLGPCRPCCAPRCVRALSWCWVQRQTPAQRGRRWRSCWQRLQRHAPAARNRGRPWPACGMSRCVVPRGSCHQAGSRAGAQWGQIPHREALQWAPPCLACPAWRALQATMHVRGVLWCSTSDTSARCYKCLVLLSNDISIMTITSRHVMHSGPRGLQWDLRVHTLHNMT